jgi:Tfp pilus assembly PilM family ATPase
MANLTPKAAGARKRKAIIALDVEGGMLRVAQASGQGKSARITRVASAALDLAPDKKDDPVLLGAALKKAFDQLKLSPKEAAFALPRGNVVLRPIQVPQPADIRELAALVNFQIAKDLPFRVEDAAVDFKVLRSLDAPALAPVPAADSAPVAAAGTTAVEPVSQPDGSKRLDLLVGAVKSDVVQFYRDAAKAAGFKLAALGLRSVGTAACLVRCGLSLPQAAVLLICVRPLEVTIDIVCEGRLVYSRVAPLQIPSADEEAEPLRQSLQIEVVRSLHSYEGSSGFRPVEKVVVAGGTGLEKSVADSLQSRLNIPAQVLDPAECLGIAQTDSREAANGLAAVGIALSALEPGGLPIDFANPKRPPAPRNTKQTRMLMAMAAALVVFITVFGVRAKLVKNRLKIKNEVQAQLTDAEKKLPIYKRLKLQSRTVNSWLAEDQNWLDHLAYLTAILPAAQDIYVSGFTTSPQHIIRFSVQAKSGELLAELDKKLRAAGYEVKPLSITPASDRNGYNFRTMVELSIPRKMKPDFSKTKPPARPADDASLETHGKHSQRRS